MATFASSLVKPAGPRPSITAAPPVRKPLVHNRNISDGERIGKIYSLDDIKAVAGKDSGIVLVGMSIICPTLSAFGISVS